MRMTRVIGAGALLLFGPALFAQEAPFPVDENKVVLLSDTHIDSRGLTRGAFDSVQDFKQCVQQVLAMNPRPAAVLLLGDLTEDSTVESFTLLRKLLEPWDRAGVRYCLTLGNHDRAAEFFKVFPEYRTRTAVPGGGVSCLIELPLADFALLETAGIGSPDWFGGVKEADKVWLNGVLKNHAVKPLFVCGHHPIDRNPVGADLLQAGCFQAWIFGHNHVAGAKRTADGIQTVGLPSSSFPTNTKAYAVLDMLTNDGKTEFSFTLATIDSDSKERGKKIVTLTASEKPQMGLIPWPAELRRTAAEFVLTDKTVVVAPADRSHEALLLATPLRRATGFPLPIIEPAQAKSEEGCVVLREGAAGELGAEAYGLTVTENRIVITAATAAGHFYGTRTLLQLLPPQAATGLRPEAGQPVRWAVPGVEIEDSPRFSWRAFMFDESRHFHGLAAVKRYVDEMAALKMNVFHWHFIDGTGWRLESKRYPKLTSLGAVSRGSGNGDIAARVKASEGGRYYYTQEEAREIVAYAALRHVRVVPEVEVPGHADAALAAYPEWSAAGVFDVTQPAVVEAVKNLIDEMLGLFPDAVIHTGGDEVDYKAWETAPSVRAAMAARGLTNSAPLQAEFTAELAKYIAGKGRRMMYWADALAQIPLEKSVILQFWRGNPALITEAVSRGYDLVNSYHVSTYLDYHYASLPLKKAYGLEPVPPGLTPEQQKHIVGIGAQAWGEATPTRFRCEQQIFPRLAALAEVAWTPADRKDYGRFVSCMKAQERRWDLAGIQYARDRSRTVEQEWEEVLSGEKIGGWTPSEIGLGKSRYDSVRGHDSRLDVTRFIRGPGRYRVGFAATGGADPLHVRLVELSENGQAVASDWGGFGGASFMTGKRGGDTHVFELVVPTVKEGASYELRMNRFGLKGSDTRGDIFIKKVGDVQPVYREGPEPERNSPR
jgi:hexosaminidase